MSSISNFDFRPVPIRDESFLEPTLDLVMDEVVDEIILLGTEGFLDLSSFPYFYTKSLNVYEIEKSFTLMLKLSYSC